MSHMRTHTPKKGEDCHSSFLGYIQQIMPRLLYLLMTIDGDSFTLFLSALLLVEMEAMSFFLFSPVETMHQSKPMPILTCQHVMLWDSIE